MPVSLNPFSGQIILTPPPGSGSGTSIGGPVTGSTPNAVLVVNPSGALGQIGPLTNGQIVIGSTGVAPVATSITGTANQITVTPGAGSITLSLPQSIGLTSSPTFNNLNLNGSTSGSISIKTQSVSGTFNFNLPTDAGTTGQFLVSQGGGSNAMTWLSPSNAIVLPSGAIPFGTGTGINTAATYFSWDNFGKILFVQNISLSGGAGGGTIAAGNATFSAGASGLDLLLNNTSASGLGNIIFANAGGNSISFQNNTGSGPLEYMNIAGGQGTGFTKVTIGSAVNTTYGRIDLIGQTTYNDVSILAPSPSAAYNFNLPTTAGTSGQFLTSQGGSSSAMTWTTPGSVTVGSLDAQAANANGAAIVSNVLSLQSADSTHPGLVNNTTQTFSGLKTFSTGINVSAGQTYQLNSVAVIKAITGSNDWFFGNAGNLTLSGASNVGVGTSSLSQLTTGAGNTAIGHQSGFLGVGTLNTSINCTYIGKIATTDGGNYTNSTALGQGSTIYASNQMVFGDTNITDNQFTGTITTTDSLNLANPQTTLTGSAGTAVCSEPFRGSSYKKVIIYLNGYTDTGTQTYTFPTAFSHTPYVYGLTAGVSGATATTTTVKFTVTIQTGFVFLEGY